MSYKELINHIQDYHLKTRFDVVCWLIGYQGTVDMDDLDNIGYAYMQGFID